MKVELYMITIREVAKNYVDNAEEGVLGYSGKLNIRPKYQREFVYDEEKRNAVIRTIKKGFPLNIMYWAVNEDDSYEVLDGQQRTISFCQYVSGYFSIDEKFFHSLTKPEQDQILNYELMIYLCDGNDREKLDWFETVNIAGVKLTKQELRNATYTGPWLSDAKLKFSRSSCPAYHLAKDYVNGSPIKQDFLETALKWKTNDNIEEYMSIHQHDPNANELWIYFRCIIEWVQLVFTTYRRDMKGLDWGGLYDKYKDKMLDANKIEQEIQKLVIDDDVTSHKGIYYYILTRDVKYLNIRQFTENQKRMIYEKQKGICKKCNKHFELREVEADHITPWSKGGKTSIDNCQLLCIECNRRKSNK